MRSKILALALASLCAAPAWAADTGKGSKQEHIGLGSGAAIGAAAGGPVGLIVGAAFGAWLGDRFHEEKSGRLAAEGRYRDAAEEANALAAELRGTEQQLARTEAALAAEETAHRSDLASALDIELYFRTEQSELPPGAEERLATLAALVAPLPDTVIVLEGHADARGTEQYNEALSLARAESVRDALIRAGMPAERIVASGTGERFASGGEQDVDAMALDRRVALKVMDHAQLEARVARQ
ncbi:MAG TPA: OmpA family protein [Gammaproteobacteria bacterium]